MSDTIYRLVQPGDVEGRSRNLVGYFTDNGDASLVGRTGYKDESMARRGEHVTIEEVRLYDSVDDFLIDHPDAREGVEATTLKERALAKLTDEERIALGLPPRKDGEEDVPF